MPVGIPTNRRRVAEVLVAMGPQRAAAMLRSLGEDKVENILADMATIELTTEEAREVLKDFTKELVGRHSAPAGLDFARAVMSDLYGADEARIRTPRIDPRNVQPFRWLGELDPVEVAAAFEPELPATVALALVHLPADASAQILRRLVEPKRSDVAFRMANLATVAPDVVEAIDTSLRRRMTSKLENSDRAVEGVELLVDVLGRTGAKLQKGIIEAIKAQDDQLAGRIQEQLFIFDDLVMLTDAAVQQVLKSIDTMDLALSLQSAISEIQDLIFRNLSERARDSLKEEIDYLQNPKPAEVKAAKARIIAVVRELEESGAIDIERPGVAEDDE